MSDGDGEEAAVRTSKQTLGANEQQQHRNAHDDFGHDHRCDDQGSEQSTSREAGSTRQRIAGRQPDDRERRQHQVGDDQPVPGEVVHDLTEPGARASLAVGGHDPLQHTGEEVVREGAVDREEGDDAFERLLGGQSAQRGGDVEDHLRQDQRHLDGRRQQQQAAPVPSERSHALGEDHPDRELRWGWHGSRFPHAPAPVGHACPPARRMPGPPSCARTGA